MRASGPLSSMRLRARGYLDLYHRHFLWEQQRVVSTTLDDAFARFD